MSWAVDLNIFGIASDATPSSQYTLEQRRLMLRTQLARERYDILNLSRMVERRRAIGKRVLAQLNDVIVGFGGEAELEDSDIVASESSEGIIEDYDDAEVVPDSPDPEGVTGSASEDDGAGGGDMASTSDGSHEEWGGF
jgi:hypothetical protein